MSVSDGLFTVQLDFASNAFTGDARWLQISGVRCPAGSGDYTTFPDRQELTATPYALYARSIPLAGSGSATTASRSDHNHWGASWSGSGTGLTLDSSNGTGLAAQGTNYGVYGQSDSTGGVGAVGYASNNTGLNYGVYGTSNSTGGYGVFGTGGYGVYATGGAGDLRLSGTGTIYANEGTTSDLELHSNDYIDLHLDDDNNSTSLLRVLNGANTTVFSVDETGAVSWASKTGYVSVSAAAFRPQVDGYDFYNNGIRVTNQDGLSDNYYAPVQLPHGAVVTRMTFYWGDSSTSDGSGSMGRNNMNLSVWSMAYVTTSGSGGDGSSYDDTISYATIDNSQYSYYLYWILPDSNVSGYGVIIQYTYTGPY